MRDPYVRRAQQDGYRSRAGYKLLEMHDRFSLFRPGMCVLDLGAAPGGWSQVASGKTAPGGLVVALDLLPMEPLHGVTRIQGDFTEARVAERLKDALGGRRPDLVLSDMAPNLSGNRVADQARMSHLHELVLELAERLLDDRGALLMKAFAGEELARIRNRLDDSFGRVKALKPKASRSGSREVYLLARQG